MAGPFDDLIPAAAASDAPAASPFEDLIPKDQPATVSTGPSSPFADLIPNASPASKAAPVSPSSLAPAEDGGGDNAPVPDGPAESSDGNSGLTKEEEARAVALGRRKFLKAESEATAFSRLTPKEEQELRTLNGKMFRHDYAGSILGMGPQDLAALDVSGQARAGIEETPTGVSQGSIDAAGALKAGLRFTQPAAADIIYPATLGEMKDEMEKPIVTLPKLTSDGIVPGVARGLSTVAEGLTTPENVALMATLAGAPAAAQKVASAGFAVMMAKHIPEQIEAIGEATTPGDKAEKVTEAIASVAMTVLAAKHAAGRDPIAAPERIASMERAALRAKELNDAGDPTAAAATLREVVSAPATDSAATPEVSEEAFKTAAQNIAALNKEAPSVPAPVAEATDALRSAAEEAAPHLPLASEEAAKLAAEIEAKAAGKPFEPPLEGPVTDTQYGRTLDVYDAFGKLKEPTAPAPAAAETSTSQPAAGSEFIPPESASISQPAAKVETPVTDEPPAPIAGREGAPADAAQADTEARPAGDISGAEPQVDAGGAQIPPEPPKAAAVTAPEPEGEPQSPTGIRNAIVDKERVARGLPERMAPLRRTFGQAWSDAMSILDKDPGAGSRLVKEIGATPRPLTDTESAILAHEQVTRQNAFDGAVDDVNAAPDEASRAEATARLNLAREDVHEVYDVGQKAGTKSGQSLAARKLLVNSDYSLARMESTARAVANQGKPLSEAQLAEVKAAHDRIAELEKKLSDHEARVKEIENANLVNEAVNEARRIARVEASDVKSKGGTITTWLDKRAESAMERIKARRGKLLATIDPLNIAGLADEAILGAAKLAHGISKFAEWSGSMISDLGDYVQPHLQALFDASKKRLQDDKRIFETAPAKSAPAGQKAPRSAAQILSELKPGSKLDAGTVTELVKAKVAEDPGMTLTKERVSEIMQSVSKGLEPFVDGVTEQQVRDAFSGHGKQTFPNREQLSVKMRELRGAADVISKIEEAARGGPVKKTGPQRDKPTQFHRDLVKELIRTMREQGIDTAPLETMIKTAHDQRVSRLKNAIEDVQAQIAVGKRTPKTPGTPWTEEELALSHELSELREKLDSLLDEPDSDVLDRLMSRIESVTEKLKSGRIEAKGKTFDVPTRAVSEARDRLAALNKELGDRRKAARDAANPPKTEDEKKLDALEKQESALTDQIRTGAIDPATGKPTADTPEVAAAKERVAALREQIMAMRKAKRDAENPPKTEDEKKLEDLLKRKAASEEALRTGNIQTRSGRPTADTADVAAARQDLREINRQLAEARKASAEGIQRTLDTYKRAIRARADAIRDKMSRGDYTRPVPQKIALDEEGRKIKADYERAKLAFDSKIERDRLKNRTLSQKFWDGFVGVERAFKLSSDIVLVKLTTAAAVREVALTPAEEIVGGMLSKALPSLAARAPREGGFSPEAEITAKRNVFTKGMSDAWRNLKMQRSDLEVQYGKRRELAPPAWYEYLGFLHGALKAPVKRAEFARSLQKRMEHAASDGVDLNDPETMLRLSQESYLDGQRAIFMGDNILSTVFNNAVRAAEQSKSSPNLGPAVARIARFLVPVIKVPSNLIGEVATGVHGVASGGVSAAKAYLKGIDTLPPDQADAIMRQLKKGLIGNALLLTGYFGANSIGGFFQKDDRRRESDVEHGRYRVGSVELPPSVGHSTAAMLLNMGASFRRAADRKGITGGVYSAATGPLKELPFVPAMTGAMQAIDTDEGMRKYVLGLVTSTAIPSIVQHAAKISDTPGEFPSNALRPANRRSPKTVTDALKVGIPGLRQDVPSPHRP